MADDCQRWNYGQVGDGKAMQNAQLYMEGHRPVDCPHCATCTACHHDLPQPPKEASQ